LHVLWCIGEYWDELVIDNDNKTAKQIKYQILKNQEKTEKLGKLLNSKITDCGDNSILIALREIITSLSDYHDRCTICYRYSEGNNCEKCSTYYLDCSCTPLTPFQITQGIGMDWASSKRLTVQYNATSY